MSDPSALTQATLVGALPPGTQLFEYRIERVLGHGGFGITYLAHDTNLDKRVAIKEYLPNDIAARGRGPTVTVRSPESQEAFKWGLASFIKEARVLGKFSHASLIQVHRYFEANNTAYFVMDYAEGVTLASVLKQEGTLVEERLRKILFPVLNGLEDVHRLGVLHRDIKPDNIILREGSLPVLIDFGAARQTLSSMTRSVMSVLTAGYAPIEQYATTGNQGPWTDLYAIGAVAYRCIAGKKPMDAVNRIRDDPMIPASVIGQGRYARHFLAAIDWALAVNVEDRPKSIADFKLALDGQLTPPPPVLPPASGRTEMTPVARPVPRHERTWVTGARLPLGATRPRWFKRGAVAAVAVVAVVLGALYLSTRQTAPPPAVHPALTAPQAQAPAPAAAPEAQPAEPPPASVAQGPTVTPKPAAKKPAAARSKLVPVAKMAPLSVFQDCPRCPLMIPLAPGTYQMGATPADNANSWEGPAHAVTIPRPFAIARYEVTVTEWQTCVDAKACPAARPGPVSGNAGKAPAVNVNWNDARSYTAWLAKATGRTYRLPSEAEWEYAIRARTAGARYWGGDRTLQCRFGNGADQSALKRDNKLPAVECDDGFPALAPVGAFEPNAFGLFDMAGNAWEWTQDCWRENYAGAAGDSRPFERPACDRRVIRGGSWRARANSLRSFGRGNSPPDVRSEDLGLRVVAE